MVQRNEAESCFKGCFRCLIPDNYFLVVFDFINSVSTLVALLIATVVEYKILAAKGSCDMLNVLLHFS